MKVAVINFSGNVGKSMVSRHLLEPRMKDASYIPVETINADESEVESVKGTEFGFISEYILGVDSVIVDVGASNVEAFITLMRKYRGSHADFDYYVVPVVKEKKQQKDTMATIEALNAIGVPANKIRLVFNKVDISEDVLKEFAALIAYHEQEKKFWMNPEAAIEFTEVFDKASAVKRTVTELAEDKTNYREKLNSLTDEAERAETIKMISAQRLAYSAHENLNTVYKLLFKK